MLETLRIKNLAVIDSAEIPFKTGLNILSGETGAGKSIVIEAISLLLGGRASADLVRSGCDEAVVEGIFDIDPIPWIRPRLEKLGFSAKCEELLIKRIVSRGGKHRIHINGELATLGILQPLCDGLIDLCGQHEHQALVRSPVQLELLDRYGALEKQAGTYAAQFTRVRKLREEEALLSSAEAERARQADFLTFQIEELRAAALEPGEDEKLQQEKQVLASAGTRLQAAESLRRVLEGAEGSNYNGAEGSNSNGAEGTESGGVLSSLRGGLNRLRGLAQADSRTQPVLDALERSIAETEDVSVNLNRYLAANERDLDPARLESVQERLSLIADLRRKYGASTNEMIHTLQRLEAELGAIGNAQERLATVGAELESATGELKQLGKKLSSARKKAADLLSTSVTGELKDLKMGEAKFSIQLETRDDVADWSASGADTIQFVVQTNAGEPAKPLGKVASGGELSRLMLAIRRVIADRGGIGVYLFDEIDAGIGGQTAFQVGKKLKSVASYNQVICITHLPQVASFADHHLVVRKQVQGKRTQTSVVELGKTDRKQELARMLGGPELTRKSLENAAELLQLASRG